MHAYIPSNGVVEIGKSLVQGQFGQHIEQIPSSPEIVQTLSQNNKPAAFLPLANSHMWSLFLDEIKTTNWV